MKIDSVRIENFRAFKDETVSFGSYSCLLGPNGAGKSTVLAALNVFFRQYKDSKTDLSKLSADDFHHKNVNDPIRITVTFTDLSAAAEGDLAGYVRQGKLIVSAVAKYDTNAQRAEVKQFGNRLGIEDFRTYFEADKVGGKAGELKAIFAKLKSRYSELANANTKDAIVSALQEYEESHADQCSLIPSEDQFYGATKGSNRLAPHMQWVFVPAVKDITEESQESKTSGLGQLLSRTIRSKVDFSEKVSILRDALRAEYQGMLDAEQSVLDELSRSLELKLQNWAHPAATAKVLWTQDPEKSVKVDEPWAHIQLGERGFEGELARFGHGMQRSFMLTLLQELAVSTDESVPTLILAIEEPELYQHPPQARYLAEVLHDLAKSGNQVVLCSHSPLFIPGDDFEAVRLVRECGDPPCSEVRQLTYADLAKALKDVGQKLLREEGMLAKLFPTLNPTINEMFFCKVLVLVEGIEDVAHISTYLTLSGLLNQFRRCGCHIVPVGGKSELIKPLAMAKLLGIPVFVVIDADTDTDPKKLGQITQHKKENASISALVGYAEHSDWPDEHIWEDDLVMWKAHMTELVVSEMGENWRSRKDEAAAHYGQAAGLNKNPLAVSRALEAAWKRGERSPSLERLVQQIIKFAERESHRTN